MTHLRESAGDVVLDIQDLNVAYHTRAGDIPAVIDFSLTLRAGETVGLVGESGCGKSTVAFAIMGYMGRNGSVTSGRILFRDTDLAQLRGAAMRAVRGRRVAMIYQEPMAALNPSMRVGEQLMEVPLTHGLVATRQDARARVLSMLADVNLPEPERVFSAYPHQISGGQQQRVVIAMALLGEPELLILDEPTTALDVTVEAGIVALIRELAAKTKAAILFISHNMGLVRETCDRIAVMYSGEVVEEGPINTVFSQMSHPYTRGLFACIPVPNADRSSRPLQPIRGQLPLPQDRPPGCNFAPRCDHATAGLCDRPGVMPLIPLAGSVRHAVRCVRVADPQVVDIEAVPTYQPAAATLPGGAAPEEILRVEDMHKHYPLPSGPLDFGRSGPDAPAVRANDGLSFTALQGQTVAIVGESGCGKSTFAKVLIGLEEATGGRIMFRDRDISRIAVEDRDVEDIAALQMIFQNPNETLNPSQTIGRQIGRVLRKFGLVSTRAEEKARVEELLEQVKLPKSFAGRKPRQLSGGQKQRIGIARAFAAQPSVVIADEPVSALDVSVQAAVTDLLLTMQRQHGTTMVFISHDLSVVRHIADRVVVMYLGRIVEQGSTRQIFEPPYHPYTEALLSAVPVADATVRKKEIVLEGPFPSPLDPPKGCPFSTRCPRKIGAICDTVPPPDQSDAPGHAIACHIPVAELRREDPVFSSAEIASS